MSHPNGGQGNSFRTIHKFADVHAYVREASVKFRSTSDEIITANVSLAADGVTQTIVFVGVNSRHGNVCSACWGFRKNCSGTRIGHCAEALDRIVP